MTNRTPRVELVYEQSCPNIAAAREQLERAFEQAGFTPNWSEWDIAEAGTPERVRGYGSPTILIDGEDVAPDTANDAACCRIYSDSEAQNKGVPPLARIVAALRGIDTAALNAAGSD